MIPLISVVQHVAMISENSHPAVGTAEDPSDRASLKPSSLFFGSVGVRFEFLTHYSWQI